MPAPDDESDDEPTPAKVPLLPSDNDIVTRILGGELAAFELIMRRYNQRLFRVARSIVGNDDEAEDVVQEAYLSAFQHLAQFAGRALFSTWLTKIALHEALSRRSRRQHMAVMDLSATENLHMVASTANQDGEHEASNKELGRILTKAVDELPDDLRTVFTMRLIEELDTAETAECLDLTEANVKVRLHRARSLLRERIDERLGADVRQLYEFGGERCDRIVHAVMTRLACQ